MPVHMETDKLLHRALPANIPAEQMLLGAVMINCDLISHVSEFLRPEHFFEVLHQRIYKAIEILVEKGLTATPITLKSMLDKDALFAEVNGPEYLAKLTTLAMVVINPGDYGKIIFDLAIKRSLIKIGEEIVNEAYDSTLESKAEAQLETAESKLYHLASEGLNEKSFMPMKYSVTESLESINRAMKNSEHVTGISTGLMDLDSKLSGFHNSDLVILAGRPSMGKTAFAINLAFNACKALIRKADPEAPKPSVGFFSLEMSSEQLASRLLSMMTKIDSSNLRSGKVTEEHYNNLRLAALELSDMPFFIDDTPALSIAAIRSRARKLKRKHNLGILFIDYLQLLHGSGKSENRVLEISQITQGLKAIAKELNIPVIALSQLSRAVEQREDKRPMLSDLRESGSIEQDADVVMFIYREEYYLTRKEPPPGDAKYAEWQEQLNKAHDVAEILIAKHRNGAIGNVQLHYATNYSSISNLQKIS
jgi:replicative DNA helicase